VPDETERPEAEHEDEEVRLHSELGHEIGRLRHPVDEVERLAHEASEGEADTTPVILIVLIGAGVAVLVAAVIGLAVLVASLVG
jgi:hypothetical protein